MQTKFFGRTLTSIRYTVLHYQVELIRIIAQMGLGAGALIIIGGTVAIVGFLTVTTGALVAVQGYTDFRDRCRGPDRIRVGLLQRASDRAGNHRSGAVGHHRRRSHRTARRHAYQRGDRRPEVMGIRSIAFLASTRVVAGFLVVIPCTASA